MKQTTAPAPVKETPGTTSPARTRTRTAGRKRQAPWSGPRMLAYQTLLVAVVLGLWQTASKTKLVDPDFLPAPTDIASWLGDVFGDGSIWPHLASTSLAMAIAFVIGSGAGIVVGGLFGRYEKLSALLSPLVLFLNAIPRVALAPLFVLYLGISIWSRVAVGVSIIFFVLLLNTLAGLRAVDADLVKLAKLLRVPARQAFWKVSFPAAVPAIFAGLKLAAVYALLGVVVGEMVASEDGLGQLIVFHSNTFDLPGVFGALIILASLATVLTMIMNFAERRLLAWQQQGNG
ncbi:ABC transporter permease [Streptomyces sp. NPDC004726]